MTTTDGVWDHYPGLIELKQRLSDGVANGTGVQLTPDLVEVALEVLLASPASDYYNIEKMASDGAVTTLAIVGPLLLRETLKTAPSNIPVARCGSKAGLSPSEIRPHHAALLQQLSSKMSAPFVSVMRRPGSWRTASTNILLPIRSSSLPPRRPLSVPSKSHSPI
jgi:hypothetical protein